jgi:hypothetical protein
MSYIEKSLLPDERIVYWSQLHWIVYSKGIFITIVGGLLGFYSSHILTFFFGNEFAQHFNKVLAGAAGIVVLIGIVFLLGAYIRQASTELAVTNHRIIAKYGFVSRTTFEIMIPRITGSNFDQTILGGLMGYGTFLINGEISPINLVADPQRFHNALMEVLGSAARGQGSDIKGQNLG